MNRLYDNVLTPRAWKNCRYTFAAVSWIRTGDLFLVQYLMRHAQIQQTLDYLRLKESHFDEALKDKMENVFYAGAGYPT